jgi:predicted acyl esterase
MLRFGRAGLALLGALVALAAAVPAQGAQVKRDIRFTTSDGVSLLARVGGEGSLAPRPTIVEFSPYGPGCCPVLAGPDFNYLQVHIRGTGDSDGAFDALGDRTQRDVAEVLQWACSQPWSNGRLGLYGFSASAIMAYNSLHRELPCVETAVMGAGTHELYRDLLYPGGIPNMVPALGVFAGIGAPATANGLSRLRRNIQRAVLDPAFGMTQIGFSFLQHPTLDGWWRERGMRGDVNDLPILMINSFYDVEPRGPFQAFQELRDDGAHMLVVGAHDGEPPPGGRAAAAQRRWYDRYLRDVPNGIDAEPKVRLLMSDGDREDFALGRFVSAEGEDWPLPGTRWESLRAGPDGTLGLTTPARTALQPYLAIPSIPTITDIHTTALGAAVGNLGNAFFRAVPLLTDMTLQEPLGVKYTTRPLQADVVAAGPASLEVSLSSTAPETDIWAMVSDVDERGVAHPVGNGRLRSSYPLVDEARSLKDGNGDIVQPYGRYDVKQPARIGQERRYRVEFWPIGNRFRRGHRIRLHVVGASAFHVPSVPAVNFVRAGGPNGARLLFPVAPGSDLTAALG